MKQLLIGFVSGKGGAGKSSITQAVATTMNKFYDLKVGIIDVDSQQSIFNLRKKEIKNFKENQVIIKELMDLKKRGKKVYDINSAEPTDLKMIAQIKSQNDITFIDMPGSLSVPGVKELYFFLDYAFIPFYVDELSYQSDRETLLMVKEMHDSGKSRLKGYGVFFNRYSERKNKVQFDALEEQFNKVNIPILAPVYENIKMQREYCTTIKAISDNMTPKSIHRLIENLLTQIK